MRDKVLTQWNATDAVLPEGTLPEMIEAQAARTPDAQAVVFESESLTYRQLNARANQLARHLRRLGVAAEVARIGFKAMMDGEGDVVTGLRNKIQSALAAVTPSAVLAEQHRRLAQPGTAKQQ